MKEGIQTGELLRNFWAIIVKRLWLIILIVIIFLGAAWIVTKRTTPIYQSTTTIFINPASFSGTDINSMMTGDRLATTYSKMIVTNSFLEDVLRRMGAEGEISISGLRGKIKIKKIADAQLLAISVDDPDPLRAAEITNTIAQALIDQNKKIQTEKSAETKKGVETELAAARKNVSDTQAKLEATANSDTLTIFLLQDRLRSYQAVVTDLTNKYSAIKEAEQKAATAINVVDQALVPDTPIKPRPRFNLFIAFLAGLFVSLVSVIVLEFLDPSFKKEEELEETLGLPVLGVIERILSPDHKQSFLVLGENIRSSVAEEMRMIRTNIKFISPDKPIKSILITSTEPQEGKSFLSANLAEIFASFDQKVALVDADLRKPTLHRFFGIPNVKGFSDILLTGKVEDEEIIAVPRRPNLKVVPSGHLPPNPAELLSTSKLKLAIEHFENENDVVILDTPPTNLVADAAIIGGQVDGVVIVAQLGKTSRHLLKKMKNTLNKTGVKILGIVLNKAKKRRGYYKKGYYYYRRRTEKPSKPLEGK